MENRMITDEKHGNLAGSEKWVDLGDFMDLGQIQQIQIQMLDPSYGFGKLAGSAAKCASLHSTVL